MIEYKEVKYEESINVGYEKVIWDDGDINYQLDGKLHRVDGPARVTSDGRNFWCIDGYMHREGDPAVIFPDGYQAWYIKGLNHREDGPAKVYPSGDKEYWLNGDLVVPGKYHQFSPLQLAKLGLI